MKNTEIRRRTYNNTSFIWETLRFVFWDLLCHYYPQHIFQSCKMRCLMHTQHIWNFVLRYFSLWSVYQFKNESWLKFKITHKRNQCCLLPIIIITVASLNVSKTLVLEQHAHIAAWPAWQWCCFILITHIGPTTSVKSFWSSLAFGIFFLFGVYWGWWLDFKDLGWLSLTSWYSVFHHSGCEYWIYLGPSWKTWNGLMSI